MRGYDFDVKALRQRLGITQQELANRLGVALSSVARWEAGHKVSRLALKQLEAMDQESKQGGAKAA